MGVETTRFKKFSYNVRESTPRSNYIKPNVYYFQLILTSGNQSKPKMKLLCFILLLVLMATVQSEFQSFCFFLVLYSRSDRSIIVVLFYWNRFEMKYWHFKAILKNIQKLSIEKKKNISHWSKNNNILLIMLQRHMASHAITFRGSSVIWNVFWVITCA